MSVSGVSSAGSAFAAQAKSIEDQIAACDKAIASAKTDEITKEKKGELARLEAQLAATEAAEAQARAQAAQQAAQTKSSSPSSSRAQGSDATSRATRAKRDGALVDLYA